MNLQAAVALAKQHMADLFAVDSARELRLETFLYDDHLMMWSLTIGFTRADARISKLVRVSEANQVVLSIKDA
jgi:hypothetical protein